MKVNEYAEIKGLEIFKVGTKETGGYTEADLDNMVSNAAVHEAPTVISHDEQQDLLAADKLPAAGWLKKIYRQGQSLFADISDVPKVVADLIQKKAIKKRSVEIYNDFVDDTGKHHGKVVRRLALLGAAIPRIKSLSDHLALYEETTDQDLSVFTFAEDQSIEENIKEQDFDEKISKIWWAFRDKLYSVRESETLSDDAKKTKYNESLTELDNLLRQEFENQFGAFSENLKKKESVMTEEEKKLAAQQFAEEFAEKHGVTIEQAIEAYKENAGLKKSVQEKDIQQFTDDLKNNGVAPVIVDEFKELLTKASFDSFGEGESVSDALKSFMTKTVAAFKENRGLVEYDEKGEVIEPVVTKDQKSFGENAERVELAQKAKAYAEEHKISYGEALVKVSQEFETD